MKPLYLYAIALGIVSGIAIAYIQKDITDHAEMNQLGMDIDREKWLKLRSEIQKEIAFRKG